MELLLRLHHHQAPVQPELLLLWCVDVSSQLRAQRMHRLYLHLLQQSAYPEEMLVSKAKKPSVAAGAVGTEDRTTDATRIWSELEQLHTLMYGHIGVGGI